LIWTSENHGLFTGKKWGGSEREEANSLRKKDKITDAYLGGERHGRMPESGSENKNSILAAVSLDDAA